MSLLRLRPTRLPLSISPPLQNRRRDIVGSRRHDRLPVMRRNTQWICLPRLAIRSRSEKSSHRLTTFRPTDLESHRPSSLLSKWTRRSSQDSLLDPGLLILADHSKEIAEINEILDTGVTQGIVDGRVVAFNHQSLRARRAELQQEDEQQAAKRPRVSTFNLRNAF